MPKTAVKKMVTKNMIKCAFCNGFGKDPFGIPSPLSNCQVCGGTGMVTVSPPTSECVFCNGTGVYPRTRLDCTVCMGKGVITVKGYSKTCPDCGGTGEAPDTLPCLTCGGRGKVK